MSENAANNLKEALQEQLDSKELILTPTEAEKVMIDKELAQGQILDNHAAFCHMYFPKLLQAINTLNSKALRRVIELAVKYPIEESDKKLKTQTEKDTFNILNQLLTSKYSMILYTGLEEMQRQEKEKENGKSQNS